MTPDQHRGSAKQFVKDNLKELCSELLTLMDTGIRPQGRFQELRDRCKLYAGIEYAVIVAENLIRSEALRQVAASETT